MTSPTKLLAVLMIAGSMLSGLPATTQAAGPVHALPVAILAPIPTPTPIAFPQPPAEVPPPPSDEEKYHQLVDWLQALDQEVAAQPTNLPALLIKTSLSLPALVNAGVLPGVYPAIQVLWDLVWRVWTINDASEVDAVSSTPSQGSSPR